MNWSYVGFRKLQNCQILPHWRRKGEGGGISDAFWWSDKQWCLSPIFQTDIQIQVAPNTCMCGDNKTVPSKWATCESLQPVPGLLAEQIKYKKSKGLQTVDALHPEGKGKGRWRLRKRGSRNEVMTKEQLRERWGTRQREDEENLNRTAKRKKRGEQSLGGQNDCKGRY